MLTYISTSEAVQIDALSQKSNGILHLNKSQVVNMLLTTEPHKFYVTCNISSNTKLHKSKIHFHNFTSSMIPCTWTSLGSLKFQK
jgi:hypothetical protein